MRWFWAPLLAVGASSPLYVRFLRPADGSEVALVEGRLAVELRVGGGGGDEFPRLGDLLVCVQLTNKRVSYESFTHCGPALSPVTRYDLAGFLPGVWRARAYVSAADASGLERGAARGVLGAADEAWFVADRGAWELEHGLTPGAARGGNVSEAEAVFEAATRDAAGGALGAALRRAAGHRKTLVVSLANGPHVGLALNLAYSARRSHCPEVFVFAIGDAALARLRENGVRAAPVPVLSPARAKALSSRRDVQSAGFGGIALLKPVAVAAVLAAGLDAWWMDTDVVLLRDVAVLRVPRSADLAIQAGGRHQRDVALGEAHFHVEACTGVFLATRRAFALVPAQEKGATLANLEGRLLSRSVSTRFG